ncbi:saccharopine dehydrogenase family protein [Candidatus Altiarchaeota archaeon]
MDLGHDPKIVDQQLKLHRQAKEKGINIVPDTGMAPGMVSHIAADGAGEFDHIYSLRMYVGCIPQKPTNPPLNYAKYFSTEGLMAEYLQPSRILRDGEIVEVGGLTEREEFNFPGFGRVEAAHNGGATSTLPTTFKGKVDELFYKTLRYPGHFAEIQTMLDGSTPEKVAAELDKTLPGGSEHPDVMLMLATVDGTKDGKRRQIVYTMADRYDEETCLTSMQRTTAFSAATIALLLATGQAKEKGVIPQETCISQKKYFEELDRRGIKIIKTTLDLDNLDRGHEIDDLTIKIPPISPIQITKQPSRDKTTN